MNPIIQTKQDLIELANRIKTATEPLALDTETNGLFAQGDKIIGFSVAFSETEGYYIPVKHRESLNIPERLVQQLFTLLKAKRLILQNGRFDIEFIYTNFGVKLPIFADTMAMAYIACFPKLGLKEIMKTYFNEDTREFKEMLEEKFGKQWRAQGYTAADLTAEDIYVYAIKDVLFTYKLFNQLKDEMKNFSSILKLELNLIPIVAQMNLEGLEIDKERLRDLSVKAKAKVADYIQEMRAVAGPQYEPNSTKQTQKVLFEQLGLPVISRTKSGAPSSSAEVLEQLAPMHPFCKTLQDYRSMNKYVSGYLDKIPNIVDKSEKLYGSFTNIGADSGRFTCPGVQDSEGMDMSVNLQNQPVNEEFDVRAAYVAPEGWTFVKCDYAQQEYRVMCNLAGEEEAIERFRKGVDFHTTTAKMMLDIPEEQSLTREQRQIGKVLNFGISYGMTVSTIARMTGHTEAEAQVLYDKYFEKLPKLRALIYSCQEQVRKNKVIKTMFGRARKLEWEGLPSRVAEDVIKKGFNTKIQGSAADISKIALLRIKDRVLDRFGREKVRLILTVHDEFDFYVRTDCLDEVLPVIKAAIDIPTPDNWCDFVCDIEIGKSWSEKDHTDWIPPENYKMDTFTGWGDILPKRYQTYLTDPNYVAQW